MQRVVILSALVASAAAFAPAPFARMTTRIAMSGGEYDGKLWDNDAKKIIYAKWNPAAPRSPLNFNPFETFEGNSPDASGFYPGEGGYKDPLRGDVSYAVMMVERKEIEERLANPKPGYVPGCPGCKN